MDEFFKAFIEAAMKEGMKEGMKGASPSPNPEAVKVDPAQLMKAAAKRTAQSVKGLYDAYVEAGFTPDQAFQLVKATLTNKKG